MITTDFIEMEMDDATLHIKKDCRDSFGILCQEIQELRNRTCTTWLFAKRCIFSFLSSLRKTPQNQSKAHALSAKLIFSFCLKYFSNSTRSWQLCITTYITNQSCRACWLNCQTQVWVKNVSVCLYPRPTWDHCEIFLTDCVSSLVCGN